MDVNPSYFYGHWINDETLQYLGFWKDFLPLSLDYKANYCSMKVDKDCS